MDLHQPKFEEYGPVVDHDVPCPVYWSNPNPPPAVYSCRAAVFHPSWQAQKDGYILIRVKNRTIREWLKKRFRI